MGIPKKHQPRGLAIVHEDKHLIVIDKEPGLLTMGTAREKERTAQYRLTDYVRKGQAKSRERVFVVHRLDREASGLLVFARSEDVKERLQENWSSVKKTYNAVVHGAPPQPGDKNPPVPRSPFLTVLFNEDPKAGVTLTSNLVESPATLNVYSARDPALGKLSYTVYRVLRSGNGHSLLEIDLLTGRKHQIRVHLSELGHPIVGDDKYGPPDKRNKRLALHARKLQFAHPVTGEALAFESALPEYFNQLMRLREGEQLREGERPREPKPSRNAAVIPAKPGSRGRSPSPGRSRRNRKY